MTDNCCCSVTSESSALPLLPFLPLLPAPLPAAACWATCRRKTLKLSCCCAAQEFERQHTFTPVHAQTELQQIFQDTRNKLQRLTCAKPVCMAARASRPGGCMSGASVSMMEVRAVFAAPCARCSVPVGADLSSALAPLLELLRQVPKSAKKPCSDQSGWCTCSASSLIC